MDSEAPPVARRPRSLWRHRDFTLMWSAHTVSQFGTQISFFVFPVIALTTLGASTAEIGLLVATESLPFLLVSLPAGVWVDRWDRRRTLIVTDLGRMAALAVVPIAFAFDFLSFGLLFAAGLAVGLLTVFFDIADQAFLPSVVETEHIASGNTRLEVSRSAAELSGPGIAGLLVQAFAAPVVLVLDVISYLVSAVLLVGVRGRGRPARPEEPGEPRRKMTTEIGEGLRFVFGNPVLRSLATCTGLMNLLGLGGALSALLTVFALGDLKLTPGSLGLMLTLGNAGALLGALLNGWLVRVVGLGRVLIGGALLSGLPMLLIAMAGPGTTSLLLAAAIALMAAGIAVYNVNQVSLRQAITPERLQGRMNASMRFAVWGALPVGAVLGGLLGEAVGVRPMLWVLGSLAAATCLPLVFSRRIRALRTLADQI